MSLATNPAVVLAAKAPEHHFPWRAILPLAVAALIALLPAPEGLAQHAW